MKQHKILLTILVLVLVSGCAQQVTIPTSLPTTYVKPTMQLSKVAANTATSAVKNTFTIHPYCPEISLDAGSRSDLMGTIVLGGEKIALGDQEFNSDSEKSVLLFWQPQSGKNIVYPLPEEQIYYYFVLSPNKEHLALTEGKTLAMTSDIIVLNNDGQEEAKFPLPGNWTLFDWLNDEKLLARQIRLRNENLDLVAIDLTTGEQQFLPSNFPNLYSFETLVFWRALTIFDPSVSFVVYPERKGNEIISILWDVENKKEIASIMGLSKWPRWAPDGKQLLIIIDQRSEPTDIGHEEIFFVKSDGEVIRSTFFNEHFEHNLIDLAVWSPNGRYVAFWQRTNLSASKLAVLDTETSTVDLYCKEFDPFPDRMGEHNTLGYSYYQINAAPPIWSPDSQYLLIEDYTNFASNTYLFDLKNHTATRIAIDTRPIGWMK